MLVCYETKFIIFFGTGMLTGDEIRSNGNAYASGCNLESSRKKFLSNIGYCPQFDGLVGVLTGREMVELFARLRGVQNVSKDCEKWLSKVGLSESKNVQCIKYSGGMKRRLSAAMVPRILF
jgi:ABC-type multidrug transport system ATPase subunit